MVDNSRRRGRRSRLLIVLLLGTLAWYVRSRRSPGVESEWPVPAPAPAPVPAPPPAVAQQAPQQPEPERPEPVAPARRDATAVSAAPVATAPTAAASVSPGTADPAPPYGEGSARALPDGSAPGPEYTIKGKTGSMLCHAPSSPYYRRVKAEVWFRTTEEASAAGFTPWAPTPRKRPAG
jgi:hypothetical protein